MQLSTDSDQKKPKAHSFKTEDHAMVLACTITGIMFPVDDDGLIKANHPHLSRVMESIDTRAEDSEEVLQKRTRQIARDIIHSIPLQEVTLPRPNQKSVLGAMVTLKKPERIVRIYQVMMLRAEIEDVQGYVHVPYQDLEKNKMLCRDMRDIIEQLNHFGSIEDFVSTLTDED